MAAAPSCSEETTQQTSGCGLNILSVVDAVDAYLRGHIHLFLLTLDFFLELLPLHFESRHSNFLFLLRYGQFLQLVPCFLLLALG